MIEILGKKKKTTKKWHRTNFFMKENKENENMKKEPEEHPAWVFGQSKTHYKAIHFTKHPSTNGKKNVLLKHNVDPDEHSFSSYAVPFREPRPKKEYKPPDKAYRIHKEDKATVNSLKNRNKKRR